MKAKEKAKELVEKFSKYVDSTNDDLNTCYKSKIKRAKQCALICVDEIQEILMSDEIYTPSKPSWERLDDYWIEVKKELENYGKEI
jgi:hypothetical protein